MTRPIYETEQTLSAEAQAAQRFANHFECELVKLPRSYCIDYALLRNREVIGWLEVKCRSHHFTTYPTLILSLNKWLAGLQLGRQTQKPFLLGVQWRDYRGYVNASILPVLPAITFCGRTDRDDPADMEPCVELTSELFTVLPR